MTDTTAKTMNTGVHQTEEQIKRGDIPTPAQLAEAEEKAGQTSVASLVDALIKECAHQAKHGGPVTASILSQLRQIRAKVT